MTIDEMIQKLEAVKTKCVLGGNTDLKFHSDELEAAHPSGDGELLYDEPEIELDDQSEPERVLVWFTDGPKEYVATAPGESLIEKVKEERSR